MHVSDGLSVHHQESKTVHTASGICHTDSVAVNKCQNNKLENCCIRLVIYLNCAMMHGLTNLKCTPLRVNK